MADSVDHIRAKLREVPNFPEPGVLFYDITTVLKDSGAFHAAIDLMAEPWDRRQIDIVAAMESRGFIFAAPLAYRFGAGFVPIRKEGKLPAETLSQRYELEYGSNVLEIHRDAIQPGQKVLLVDDVLATGGTAATSIDIVRQLGGDALGLVVLIELDFLRGRERLAPYEIEIQSFIHY